MIAYDSVGPTLNLQEQECYSFMSDVSLIRSSGNHTFIIPLCKRMAKIILVHRTAVTVGNFRNQTLTHSTTSTDILSGNQKEKRVDS